MDPSAETAYTTVAKHWRARGFSRLIPERSLPVLHERKHQMIRRRRTACIRPMNPRPWPCTPGSPATGRTWTCPWQRSCGPCVTTPTRTATSWHGSTSMRPRADASPTGRSSARCWTRPASRRPRLRRYWSGNLAGSPVSGSTPLPSSPCSGARASASSPSPSTQTTPPPAGSWRPSSSRWTSSTAKIWPRRFAGE